VLELALGEIQPHRSSARLRQGDRPLGGAATEFQDVLAVDVSQDLELRFRDLPDTPGHAATGREQDPVPLLVRIRGLVPGLTITKGVRSQGVGRGFLVAIHPGTLRPRRWRQLSATRTAGGTASMASGRRALACCVER
jgi:hypothetical protein